VGSGRGKVRWWGLATQWGKGGGSRSKTAPATLMDRGPAVKRPRDRGGWKREKRGLNDQEEVVDLSYHDGGRMLKPIHKGGEWEA